MLNTLKTKHWLSYGVKWAHHSPLVSQLNYGHELLTANNMVTLPFYLLYHKTSAYKFSSSGSKGRVHWVWTPLMLSAKILSSVSNKIVFSCAFFTVITKKHKKFVLWQMLSFCINLWQSPLIRALPCLYCYSG